MLPVLLSLTSLVLPVLDLPDLVAPDLVAPGGEQPRFGAALAHDGEWLAVGAPDAQGQGPAVGAVVLWRRAEAGWSRVAVLGGDGRAQGRFGRALDLKGERLAVGAYFADGPVRHTGAVYMFEDQGGWAETARLAPPDAKEFDGFGWSVALDGDRLLVGAPFASRAGFQSGDARIYRQVAGRWVEEAVLRPEALTPFDHLGWSVAWADGRALVGAPDSDLAGPGVGAVFVFQRRRGRWTEGPPLSDPTLGLGAGLGQALAGDRARVVAGAPGVGVVKVWRRRGGAFEEEATLAGALTSRFGAAVALSGTHLGVGAPLEGDGGALHTYRRQARAWSPNGSLLGERGSELGAAAAVTVLGSQLWVLAGAPRGEGGCRGAGPCAAGRVESLR
jgi:FG-GAP repeat